MARPDDGLMFEDMRNLKTSKQAIATTMPALHCKTDYQILDWFKSNFGRRVTE